MKKFKIIFRALRLALILLICISVAYWIYKDIRRWVYKRNVEKWLEETDQQLIEQPSTFLDSEIE